MPFLAQQEGCLGYLSAAEKVALGRLWVVGCCKSMMRGCDLVVICGGPKGEVTG